MPSSAIERIDQLINKWEMWEKYGEYYLTKLIPNIVAGNANGDLDSEEKQIFSDLKKLLNETEWMQLSKIVEQRLSTPDLEIGSDRIAREIAEERAKKREAERLLKIQNLEQERLKRQQDDELRQKKLVEAQLKVRKEEQQKLEEQLLKKREEQEKRDQIVRQIDNLLINNYLAVDEFYAQPAVSSLINKSSFELLKTEFVQAWINKKIPIFSVDDEQASAISATTGDIQVIARAGSGKTRTLVARAVFLQEHCHVPAEHLLLLAFNGKAVEEIQERIKSLSIKVPHVMTFHALAYAVVHPEEELLYDDSLASQLKLSHEIQDVINEHIQSPDHLHLIRDIMLMHFREDWDAIIGKKQHLNLEERRALPHESLKGEYVKSFGEKAIANILFENSVEYKYERYFRWNGIKYRPDFTILTGINQGIVIEYFGLQGEPDYDEMSEQKRAFWRSKPDWKFLEYSPSDLAHSRIQDFENRLISDLEKLGIKTTKRSDEEIWDLISDRAIDSFTGAIRSFVGRCRKRNLSVEQLINKIDKQSMLTEVEQKFLTAAVSIYADYLQKLKTNNKEDFDGLMWRAIETVKSGQTNFVRNRGKEQGDLRKLKFILVDEFQDFSEMFFQLCKAIRGENKEVQFFCVGDDWQAINEFAGSELRFFQNFGVYFNNPHKFYISNNYRSPKSIVNIGNALMHGLGSGARAAKSSDGESILCSIDSLNLTASEQALHNGDEITPALLRLIMHYLGLGREITLLSRRNGIAWYVNYSENSGNSIDLLEKFREHITSFFPKEDRNIIKISTTHKAKGNQHPVIIIIDGLLGSYPLIHPNWIFLRIFGDNIQDIEAAERRLFYVALTRSEESLIVISENDRPSHYLGDIEKYASFRKIDWKKFPPPPSLSPNNEVVEVQISDSFDVKEKLKNSGYRWNSTGKYWSRTFQREGFVFEDFIQQPWVNNKVKINVYSETLELLYRCYPQDRLQK